MGDQIDVDVVSPKYSWIVRNLDLIAKNFYILCGSCNRDEYIMSRYGKSVREIEQFADNIIFLLKEYYIEKKEGRLSESEIEAINANPDLLQKMLIDAGQAYNAEELKEAYHGIRSSEIIDHVFTILARLKTSTADFADEKGVRSLDIPKNPRPDFIIDSEESSLDLLYPVTALCFRIFFYDGKVDNSTKNLSLSLLGHLYKLSMEIYDTIMAPDIDVHRLSNAVSVALEHMKKIPELSDCGRAFRKIKRSMRMFESNYQRYHIEFIKTKNPNVIFENFFNDMAMSEKDLVVLSQLKKIMAYFKRTVEERRLDIDPRISTLFDTLTRSLGESESE